MCTSISFPQVTKLHDTLLQKGVTPELWQDKLLGEGRIADIAEACVAGTIPPRDEFRKLLGLGPLYKTDKHGRILVTLTGRGWTNEEWSKHGETGGMNFTKWARDILGKPDYNEKHRLEPGKQYTVALLFGKKEFDTDTERTTANLRARGERDYGKSNDLRGELALLIREAISDEQLERWGIYYVAVPHEPIIDSDGSPDFLASYRYVVGQQLLAYCAYPGHYWHDDGAFAFPVSQ
ncbi:MAG: hypothetical protein IPJ68_04820 [Candidatus Moraniibacteriota bacterium]|nr:MAG: hypothetical protein IPJ68_04820 [Candidatus Moranbacteria bacterium]